MLRTVAYGESCCLVTAGFSELMLQVLQNTAAAREKTW